jgi:hypothetical protein
VATKAFKNASMFLVDKYDSESLRHCLTQCKTTNMKKDQRKDKRLWET